MLKSSDGTPIYDSDGPIDLNLTAMVYWTDRRGGVAVEMMNIDTNGVPIERELRVHRPRRSPNAKMEAIDDREKIETLVVISPRTSASRAIGSLKRLIACIEENGLVTGIDEKGADYYAHEKVKRPKSPR
jgi:hypothetical protein